MRSRPLVALLLAALVAALLPVSSIVATEAVSFP